MGIKCNICGFENADNEVFCTDCGNVLAQAPTPPSGPDSGTKPLAGPTPGTMPPASGMRSAKLFIKRYGTVSNDSIPLQGMLLVLGRFDPSAGPVDIDVSGMPGAEHVSRRHAELAFDAGVWKVRDLGSTNGVFIRRASESGFSPRIQEPTELQEGDEVAFGNLTFVFKQG